MSSLSRLGQQYVRSSRRSSASERRGVKRHRLALGLLEDRSLPSFLAPVDYPAGSNPGAMATGRFNNDAIADLVVANPGTSTVSVLLGNGDGTFQPAISSPAGSNPYSVAVGDFNADGKMDLATANAGDVSVLLGNGDGTFQAPTNMSVGDSPVSVAVGDFNADGKMDMGVTSNTYYPGSWGYYGFYPGWYVGRASVFIGNGAASFTSPVTTWLGYGYHSGAAVEDFNGDGRDDFAAADYEYGTVGVALADASGTLQGASYFSVGYYPGAVAAGDVNGDNKADLVTANWYGDTVGVILGNGLGGFGAPQTYATGGSPVAVVLGDFNGHNGDGKVDIAVSTGSGSGVSVLLGRGDGTFAPPLPSSSNSYLSGVAAGDFNGDGWLDAVAANSSGNSASVFANDMTWPPLDAPSLSITDATVTEGNTGTVTAAFTVNLSAAYGLPVTVHYATVDGSATVAGGDYVAASGTLTFAPGDTTKTIPVAVNGDHLAEWDESFSVRLSAATNAFASDPIGWGTIHDDEPTVDIISSVSGNEGNTGTTAFNFTVTLSADYDAPVSVDYATADLSGDEQYWYGPGATAGVDYQATSGTLTFGAHETSKTITVLVNGDLTGESSEYFWVNLSNPTSAHLGYYQSLAAILDDEPYLSITGGSVTERNSGTATLNFNVTLSTPSTTAVTVKFTTADGSATAPGDYQAKTGTVTFAPGSTSMPVAVTVNGDRLGEGDEYLYVNLSDAAGALIATGSAYGSILDDEPRLSINSPAAIKEGNSGTSLLKFTVKLSAPYDQAVTVRYTTYDYSATAGSDYVATSGTLTFAAGQTTKTFTVQIKGDKKRESNESFYVLLSSPSSNASIWEAYGWGTIKDDDGRHGRGD